MVEVWGLDQNDWFPDGFHSRCKIPALSLELGSVENSTAEREKNWG
jgi:hypothetical protein